MSLGRTHRHMEADIDRRLTEKRRIVGPRAKVTIRDVAAQVGLSITTVSHALNGHADVSEVSRRKIVNAAKRLGYYPNRSAQRLVTRRTGSFGWLRTDNESGFVDPHFVEVMAGVLRGARRRAYDVLFSSDTDDAMLDAHARHVANGSVDGFILDLPRPFDPRIDYLLSQRQAFVAHGRDGRSDDYGWVDIDNDPMFETVANLLLKAGHKRIAFVNGDPTYSFAQQRLAGARRAFAQNGVPVDQLVVVNTQHPMTRGGSELTEDIIRHGSVSAIIYSSVLIAYEGMSALTRAGLQPGRDMTIFSMDDGLQHLDLSPFAGHANFVHSSLQHAGEAIAEELWHQIVEQRAPQGTLLDAEFILTRELDASLVPPKWRKTA